MFKKTLALFFSVLFAISSFAFAVNATEVPPVPTDLSIKYGQKLADIALDEGFSWVEDVNYDAELDGEFEATDLEVTVTVICTHSWGEYHSNGDAGFLKDGTKTRTCKICGATDESVVDKGTNKLQVYLLKIAGSGKTVSTVLGKVIDVLITVLNKVIELASKALNK